MMQFVLAANKLLGDKFSKEVSADLATSQKLKIRKMP